jgi:hypothetical protein
VPLEKPRALRKMAELLYGNPVNYRKMGSDLKLSEERIARILEVYAEKAEFLDGARPSRSSRVVPLRRP